jgi:hypothetical protein
VASTEYHTAALFNCKDSLMPIAIAAHPPDDHQTLEGVLFVMENGRTLVRR